MVNMLSFTNEPQTFLLSQDPPPPPTPPQHCLQNFALLCELLRYEKQSKLCETAFDKLLFLLASLCIQRMLHIKSSDIYFFSQRSFQTDSTSVPVMHLFICVCGRKTRSNNKRSLKAAWKCM